MGIIWFCHRILTLPKWYTTGSPDYSQWTRLQGHIMGRYGLDQVDSIWYCYQVFVSNDRVLLETGMSQVAYINVNDNCYYLVMW